VSDAPILIYLETDDEITTVVRRMRAADPGRVVIVAPGRSRATSSTVALRLLARTATADGRKVSIVGDALTRSLAAEAGIAAFASVDDARRADPDAPVEPPSETRTAAIHVVRGPVADDTAPTLTAVAAAAREADTRPSPAVRPSPTPPQRRRPSRRPQRRRLPPAALAAIVLAVLMAWGAIAALVLPAAAITITSRTVVVGPADILLSVRDVDPVTVPVNDTETVTATGTYDINDPSRGRVTFFNFNFFDVNVPAESLVATGQEEGDQAYATNEAVTVPAGTFDPLQGGIMAGEASVDVTAAAPGPDGNVPAQAIDTVLDPSLASQLRGFPNISNALVTNREATSGGVTDEGPEFTEEDVQRAASALTDALWAQVEEEFDATTTVFADSSPPPEPEIEGLDDLIGRRDEETVDIRGSLTVERLTATREHVESLAIERAGADEELVPAGWQLDGAAQVDVGVATWVGNVLTVEITVTGTRRPVIERDAVLREVMGRSEADAEQALADLGSATVELWPLWVSTVPNAEWRIELEVVEP
jgi:hypothetical protein